MKRLFFWSVLLFLRLAIYEAIAAIFWQSACYVNHFAMYAFSAVFCIPHIYKAFCVFLELINCFNGFCCLSDKVVIAFNFFMIIE